MTYVERLYTFECPECKNKFTYDEPGEPMCDGPGELKAHEAKVMRRIRVVDKNLGTKEVSEAEAELRAQGTLLTPESLAVNRVRINGKLYVPKDKELVERLKDEGFIPKDDE